MSQLDENVYLVIYGAYDGGRTDRPVRHIRHIAHERDGEMVPRCNSHYVASHDKGPRRFRVAEGVELAFPTCKRCLAWKGWRW